MRRWAYIGGCVFLAIGTIGHILTNDPQWWASSQIAATLAIASGLGQFPPKAVAGFFTVHITKVDGQRMTIRRIPGRILASFIDAAVGRGDRVEVER